MSGMNKSILDIKNVYKYYDLKTLSFIKRSTEKVKAVRGLSLSILEGETIGIVGESGCGKTTLAKLVVKLETPLSGTILFQGRDIFKSSKKDEKILRQNIQLIFQNPFMTFSPQMTIGAHIADTLIIHNKVKHKKHIRNKVNEILDFVGLPPSVYDNYPENFGGGELQMANIARAMAVEPKILISDEGISILDVTYQAKILNLMRDLQEKFHLGYIIITHDFSVVRHICDRIAVMYLGKIVELGSNNSIFNATTHPYTRALINAIPTIRGGLDGKKITPLSGEVPSPIYLPPGCTFHPRCPIATEICRRTEPILEKVKTDQFTACHHWKEVC